MTAQQHCKIRQPLAEKIFRQGLLFKYYDNIDLLRILDGRSDVAGFSGARARRGLGKVARALRAFPAS